MGSGYWFCPRCSVRVEPEHVTYTETHDECGQWVSWVTDDSPPYDELRAQLAEKDKVIERLREGERRTLDDIVGLIAGARDAIGAVDGYDYRSGEEYGLRTALIIIEKYRAALNAAPNTDGAQ